MDIKLIREKDMPLLSRKRMSFMVQNPKTPSRGELAKEIGKQAKVSAEHVIIVRMSQEFGKHKCKVIAHVYTDAEALKRLEPEHLVKRMPKAQTKEDKQDGKEEKAAEKDQ